MPWFAIRLESRRERIALNFLHLANYETYAPRTGVTRTVRGQAIEYRPLLFPNYVFVRSVDLWGAIRGLPGVIGPVLNGAVRP